MAAPTAPPAPYTRDFKDTSITVWYRKDRLPAGCTVALEVKEFGNPAAAWKRVTEAVDPETASHTVTGLHPGGTFQFRWIYKWADGFPETAGAIADADTLAAGCVPKDENEKKKGCTVQ